MDEGAICPTVSLERCQEQPGGGKKNGRSDLARYARMDHAGEDELQGAKRVKTRVLNLF
jgi:hypothetical protein